MTEEGDPYNNKVETTVKGGATAFPFIRPRPPPVKTLSRQLWEFARSATRNSLLCTSLAYATRGFHRRYMEWFTKRVGKGEEWAFAALLCVTHIGTYLGWFALSETLDRTRWLRRYKLYRTPASEPSWAMKRKTVVDFLVGNLFLAPVAFAKLLYPLLTNNGMPSMRDPLNKEDFLKTWGQMTFAYVFQVTTFTMLHRTFHYGPLYRQIHRTHHRYVGTVSIAAENAEPAEQILVNLPTTLGAILLLKSFHPYAYIVHLFGRFIETYEGHSGYCFYDSLPHRYLGLTHAEIGAYHDAHLFFNKGNFGNEFLDGLFATQDHWNSIGGIEGYVAMSRKLRAEEGYP